jgi:MFS family permease
VQGPFVKRLPARRYFEFDKTELSSWLKTPLPLFALAHGTHDMALSLLVPLLPLIRNNFSLSYLEAGLLVSAYSITSGISQLPMGWVADRVGPRRMIVAGLSGVGLAALTISFTHTFTQMLPILILMGIIAGAYHPSSISHLPLYFSEERRGRALGFHLWGGATGFMLGPFLGGIIARIAGWRAVYMILSIPAILTALLLLGTLKHEWKTSEEKEAEDADGSIWDTLRGIALILGISVSVQLLVGSAVNYFPIFFVDIHAVDAAYAAMLLALVRFGSSISGPIGGFMSDRFGIKKTVVISVVGVGPTLFLVAVLPFNLMIMLITLFLLGAFLMIRQSPMQALIIKVSSKKHRSTLLGLYFFLSMEGMSLMNPVAGYFMDRFGLFPAFFAICVATLILSVTTLFSRSKL